MNIKIKTYPIIYCTLALSIGGCANTTQKYPLDKSYLESNSQRAALETKTSSVINKEAHANIETLQPLIRPDRKSQDENKIDKLFDDKKPLAATVNNLTLKSFIQYTFGNLLDKNYILEKNLKLAGNVTLNLSSKITAKKLFNAAKKVLNERGIGLRYSDDVFYFYNKNNSGKPTPEIGFGRNYNDIPQVSGEILQVIPLKYGVRISLERTLNSLVDAKITSDFDQGALFVKGSREQIVKTIDLISVLDIPANRGKHIALISPTYITIPNFIENLSVLLKAEGIELGATDNQNGGNLVVVPLNQLGSVAVFSAEKTLMNRVKYWADKIDKPSQGAERQYHIYTPRFARASDLAESLAPLISGVTSTETVSTNQNAKQKQSTAKIANSGNSVSKNGKLSMVVDKRSNMLIFNASGSEYQSLLPLIQRLDILPKQVLLDVTIAEVKMTGTFKRGFEFAVQSGQFSGTTKGSLGLTDISGLGVNWTGNLNQVLSKFAEGNSQVNILSKPSLLVRDGTEANINVGDKIPISSGSTLGANNTLVTNNLSYQETGIKLKVTPTVNAQGVVIMKITQDISNQVPGVVGVGNNPQFFQRSLSTEVVADSGQTVLLGGLISEDSNSSNNGIPGLKSIPLLGGLFESESKSKTKTELVILMTPKIVERSEQWQNILNKFKNGLQNIKIE